MDTSSNFQSTIPGAPPPPPEVKVRTMRSDLESMAKSGGGAPRFQNVAVAGLATQNEPSQAGEGAAQQSASAAPKKSLLGPILVVIVALVAVAVVGYFAYTIFHSSAPAQTQPSVATSTTP